MIVAVALAAALTVQADTACLLGGILPTRTVNMPVNAPARARSPLDSLSFNVADSPVKICYGRPSARGRTMLGGSVAFGSIWRTGANEPTMIHSSVDLMIAGVHVPAGTHAIYTVPGEREWEIVINRSYRQWGHESAYSDSIRAQELGRGRAPVGQAPGAVEQFTIRAEPGRAGAVNLLLEWERTRVTIPVSRMGR